MRILLSRQKQAVIFTVIQRGTAVHIRSPCSLARAVSVETPDLPGGVCACERCAQPCALSIYQKTKGSEAMDKETLQQSIEFEKSIARRYAPEFVSALADTANETLRDWLRAAGAPQAVIDLLDDATMLERCARALSENNLLDGDALWLAQSLADATEHIAQLGGEFHSPESCTLPRKDVITWQITRAET